MKICLIFRPIKNAGFSIEEIYNDLANSNNELYTTYYLTGNIINDFRKLRKINVNIYHFTGGYVYLIPFLAHKNTIYTIHDIGRYKELVGLKKLIYWLLWIFIPYIFCKKLVTVSDFTKADILKRFSFFKANKIEVIHNSIPSIFKDSNSQNNIENRNIAIIGTNIHKNIETTIRACKESNYTLHIIGKLSDFQMELLQSNQVNYINYYKISYLEVKEIYAMCFLLVFISLHEGFGMPIIEAQSMGIPVIASTFPALQEVGRESVYYVKDPLDYEELKEKINQMFSDKILWAKYRNLGFQNVNRFSKREIMEKHLQLYKSVLMKNNYNI